MHEIDTPTAIAGQFVEKDPNLGQAATQVSDDWLNAIQGEIVNAVEAAGLVLNKADNSQLAAAIGLQVAPSVFRKNAIINGGFDVNQRFPLSTITTGLAFTSATTEPFYVDRWRVQIPSGAGSMTVKQEEHPLDVTAEDLPQSLVAPHNYLSLNCTVAYANEAPAIETRIEGVRTFANSNVVVSFRARLNSGTSQVVPKLQQNFGTSGSTSVDYTGSAITLTNAWKKYEASFTLGSLSGKSVAVSLDPPDDYLSLRLELDQGQTFDVDVSNVQLERGTTSTEFEAVRFEQELRECLRYYEKSGNEGSAQSIFESQAQVCGCWDAVSGNICKGAVRSYKVVKRAPGTVVWYSGGSGSSTANRILWGGTSRTVSGLASGTASIYGTGQPECTTNPGTLREFEANWTVDAEL